jgi:hypothetical protein
MGRTGQLSILALCAIVPILWAVLQIPDVKVKQQIAVSILVSILGFFGTLYLR